MAVRRIVFQGLNDVVCRDEDKELTPSKDGVVIETHYSCISAGTEVAKLTGLQEIDFPIGIGNRSIGRVVAVGPNCRDFGCS